METGVGMQHPRDLSDILYSPITPGPGMRQRQVLLASSLVEKTQAPNSARERDPASKRIGGE